MKVSWLKFLNQMVDIKVKYERNMRGFFILENPLFL